jgi:hypothetical protein
MSVILAAHTSATAELAVSTDAVAAAVGLLVGVAGWGLHHEFARDHKIIDMGAKLMIIGGSTLLLGGPGAHFLPMVNGWTAGWMAALFRFTKISDSWPHWFGLLTLIEPPMLTLAASDFIHQLKPARQTPGLPAGVGGSAGAKRGLGKIFARLWDRV